MLLAFITANAAVISYVSWSRWNEDVRAKRGDKNEQSLKYQSQLASGVQSVGCGVGNLAYIALRSQVDEWEKKVYNLENKNLDLMEEEGYDTNKDVCKPRQICFNSHCILSLNKKLKMQNVEKFSNLVRKQIEEANHRKFNKLVRILEKICCTILYLNMWQCRLLLLPHGSGMTCPTFTYNFAK